MRKEIGSLIGAIGGITFVEVNASSLPGPVRWPVRIVGILGFVAVVWYAVIRPRGRQQPSAPRSPRSIRIYWMCVAAEVAAIPLGSLVITRVFDQPLLTLAWVVLVLGVHFLPFAKAFAAPLFAWLGVALIGVAVVGGVLTVAVDAQARGWMAVVAGFVLLAFSALGGRGGRAEEESRSSSP